MKPKKSLFFSSLMLIILVISNCAYAQEKSPETNKYLNHLTAKQKKILKEQQLLVDKTRAIFKQNLSKEQLAILNNRTISKEQRIKLLRSSLSQKQRDQISSNRNLLRVKRDLFRKSLTKRQKLRLRRFLNNRNVDDRRRLVRRLRRLIRDNNIDR